MRHSEGTYLLDLGKLRFLAHCEGKRGNWAFHNFRVIVMVTPR